MSKYDAENLLHDLKAILVANLNTYIAAIESEKVAQGLPATNLASVDTTNGYFEQNWSDGILNITPAIFYGIEDVRTEGYGPVTSQLYKVWVEIVLVDTQVDKLMTSRIHRYSRAIKDVLEDNWDKLPSASKTKIETIRPLSFKLDLNSSEEIRVGGVSIITSLA